MLFELTFTPGFPLLSSDPLLSFRRKSQGGSEAEFEGGQGGRRPPQCAARGGEIDFRPPNVHGKIAENRHFLLKLY